MVAQGLTMRKWLFWGITLVLVVALINLIIQGRRLEKKQASKSVEIVQESKPTPTRAFEPRDLEIVRSAMALKETADNGTKLCTARHEIEIRNNGRVSYIGFQLSFEYLDRRGKILETKTRLIDQRILPGADLKVAGIKVDGLPVSTVNCRLSVTYADIGHNSD